MEIPQNLLPGDEALCDFHQCHCMFYGLRSTHWTFVKKKKRKIIISLTTIFQRIKYLEMYLIKDLKDLYTENSKILIKKN